MLLSEVIRCEDLPPEDRKEFCSAGGASGRSAGGGTVVDGKLHILEDPARYGEAEGLPVAKTEDELDKALKDLGSESSKASDDI